MTTTADLRLAAIQARQKHEDAAERWTLLSAGLGDLITFGQPSADEITERRDKVRAAAAEARRLESIAHAARTRLLGATS